MQSTLPEGIIARFRTLSLERIGRVESVWNALITGVVDDEAVRGIARDLHTLKGDARIVGFEEVHVLSHKLEELLGLAGQMEFRVSEDFELVVTMATQFVGMLLRNKKSNSASGIDLAGFVRQVDEVLRETRLLRRSRPTNPRLNGRKSAESSTDRLSESTQQRLAAAATDAFIEYLSARPGTSRMRLRRVWETLSQELSKLHTAEVGPLLERHIASSQELANELGKQIDFLLDMGDLRLDSRIAEAVDIAIVHLIRNAIDHGIETPVARRAIGKSERGKIRIHTRDVGNQIEITVDDDGSGIDLQRVRAKAIEQRLLEPDRVLTEKQLHELLFAPGFTTKQEVTDVSGRGVGMDAVKAAIVKIGGNVRLSSHKGAGTSVVLSVPAPMRQLRVYQFLAPGNAVNLAVSARWSPSTCGADGAIQAIDPVTALELNSTSRQTLSNLAPPQNLVLHLRWGFLELALRTATEPKLTTAERICPTPDDYPIEVIQIDGVEALLIRPEVLSDRLNRH